MRRDAMHGQREAAPHLELWEAGGQLAAGDGVQGGAVEAGRVRQRATAGQLDQADAGGGVLAATHA